MGYPSADELRQDVNTGFDMLGQVRSAPGWRPRSDERYARPDGLDRLRRENPLYVARKAARPRDEEHTKRSSTSWWRRHAGFCVAARLRFDQKGATAPFSLASFG